MPVEAPAVIIREEAEALEDGRHEMVTLAKETSTPRARSLTATFKRERTPPGESQPARRQRKKNEGKARARALCRLDADDHARYKEAERKRKRPRAVPDTSWAPLIYWQPSEASGGSDQKSSGSRLQEHVQLTPRGSRVHRFEHTSPGGTRRLEQYTSPADARATREQRRGWRSRIARARIEARGMVVFERYWTACMHCGREQHIMPDGCMVPHSHRETVPRSERAGYRESQAFAEHGWSCPGSRVYYGPCEEEDSGEEEDSSEEEDSEEEVNE